MNRYVFQLSCWLAVLSGASCLLAGFAGIAIGVWFCNMVWTLAYFISSEGTEK